MLWLVLWWVGFLTVLDRWWNGPGKDVEWDIGPWP